MNKHKAMMGMIALAAVFVNPVLAEAGTAVKDKDGFIQGWLVCGPFPNYRPDDNSALSHHTQLCWGYAEDFLKASGGETGIDPAESQAVGYDGKQVAWQKHLSPDYFIDFSKIYPLGDNKVAYAYCEIDAERATNGIITVGSDDGVKIWLNRKLIHDHHLGRGTTKDDDVVVTDFRKGKNQLLVKVDNDWGGFGFCLRVLLTENEKRGFYRDKLTVEQDRYVLFSNEEQLTLQVAVATNIPPGKYQADVRIKVVDPKGNTEQIKDVYRLGDDILVAPKEHRNGVYQIILTAADAGGEKELTGSFYFLAAATIEKLADKMASAEPFKQAAYLAVAADIERLKVAARANPLLVAEVSKEIDARLDVLEDGKLDANDWGIYDLLPLTANPEAQVVIEFNQGEKESSAAIAFYWGSIPLASVRATEFTNAAAAVSNLDKQWGLLAAPAEKTTVEQYPARLSTMSFQWELMSADRFDPTRQVLLVRPAAKFGLAVELARLSLAQAEAAVILPDGSPAARTAVEAWSQKAKAPVLDLKEAMTKEHILIAGDVRLTPDAKEWRLYTVVPVDEVNLRVAAGKRIFSVRGMASRQLAEQVIGMAIHAKPVMSEEVDALRLELVQTLAPKREAVALPEGLRLFCGDLHTHTFYSDGFPSPAGLAFESLYCNMDFVVITDHNTLAGAQVARKLFSDYGFDYSIIVGEEITTVWAHLNAYPLQEAIPVETLSSYEIVKRAHRQGAVIQWNHPGFTTSEFEISHLRTGLVDTGCDAWEHYAWRYDEWKQKGIAPVLVGSTDTHNGRFDDPERTIILAPTTDGDDVAEAIRRGRTVMVTPDGGRLLYGADRMTALVWAALAEGKSLKAAKAEQLRSVLKKADLAGLLRASSPTKPVLPQAVSKPK